MSVRVHQLSKKIGMDNKELLRLLSERGFEVKSASSTIYERMGQAGNS